MAAAITGSQRLDLRQPLGGGYFREIKCQLPCLNRAPENAQYIHQLLLRMSGKILAQISSNPAAIGEAELEVSALKSAAEVDSFFREMPELEEEPAEAPAPAAAADGEERTQRESGWAKASHYGQFSFQSLGQANMRLFYPDETNHMFLASSHSRACFCTISDKMNPMVGEDPLKSFGLFVEGFSQENRRYYLFDIDDQGTATLIITASQDHIVAKLNEWSPADRYIRVHAARLENIGK